MDAVEYFKEKYRLTKNCTINCSECRVGSYYNIYKQNCREFEMEYPEKAFAIIKKWSKDCPKETVLMEFMNHYPNAILDDDNLPENVCPYKLNKKYNKCSSQQHVRMTCEECWNQPVIKE